MNKKVTSKEIKVSLAKYHEKDFFITECKNGSTYFPPPQGLLKFDGLAITKSYTQPCIKGYEIKVSRSDFLQDNKWHLYLQYCNEFYFVVPKGLIKKEELPDNVGLIYYNPDTGKIRTRKKALWREIDEPVGVYKYIIFSRLEHDRMPFYESRAEYAKDYLQDKNDKQKLGKEFGSKLVKDLVETQTRLSDLQDAEEKVNLLKQIRDVMDKYDVGRFCFRDEDIIKELEEALKSSYPKNLDIVKGNIENALTWLNKIEEKNSGKKEKEEKK